MKIKIQETPQEIFMLSDPIRNSNEESFLSPLLSSFDKFKTNKKYPASQILKREEIIKNVGKKIANHVDKQIIKEIKNERIN